MLSGWEPVELKRRLEAELEAAEGQMRIFSSGTMGTNVDGQRMVDVLMFSR